MTIKKLFYNLNTKTGNSVKMENEAGTSKCYGCNGPIQDPYILQVYPNLQWHMNCLKCIKCSKSLDNETSCYVRDGKIYCREDYLCYFLYRCAGCYQTIKKTEFVMRVRSQTYHVACFKCTVCQKSLQPGEEIAFKSNLPYCLADANFSYLPKLANHHHHHHHLLGQDIIKNETEVSPDSNSLRKSLMNSSTEDGSILEELKLSDEIDECSESVHQLNGQFDEIKEYLNLRTSSKLRNEDSISNSSRPQSPLSSTHGHLTSNKQDEVLDEGHQKMLKAIYTSKNNNGSLVSDPEEADSDEDFYDDLEDIDNESDSILGNIHPNSTGSTQHSQMNSLDGQMRSLGHKFQHNRQMFLQSGSSSTSSHHNRSYMNSKSASGKRSKEQKTTRVRTVLNEKQLHMLRTCYAANPRPDALMKEQLVEMTGLSPRVIRVWFQNKRCKDKKKQILIKQMEQHHQAGQISCTLQGVPMVASSPVPNDASMLNSGSSVEVHQFPRINWPSGNKSSENGLKSDDGSTSGQYSPSSGNIREINAKMNPKFPPINQINQNNLYHSPLIGGQTSNGTSDPNMETDSVSNFTQLQSQSPMSSMQFSRISQAT